MIARQKYNLYKFNLRTNRKIGKWTLAKKIGSGGNGEVWTCRDSKKMSMPSNF